MVEFMPFTEDELVEYADKLDIDKRDIIEEMKKIGMFLPRILCQCETPISVERWVNKKDAEYKRKVEARLQQDGRIDKFCQTLMNASMSIKLTTAQEAVASEDD